MFFHVGIYDYILFKEWVPQTLGTYFASLFVVFIMSILGEGLESPIGSIFTPLGFRALKQRIETKFNDEIRLHLLKSDTTSLMPYHPQRAPFIARIEFARGLLRIVEVFIHYFLMLIAMTFNVGLFLAVIVGAGVGKYMWPKNRF